MAITIDAPPSVAGLTEAQAEELERLLEEDFQHTSRSLFHAMFPDETAPWLGATNKDFQHGQLIFARHLYPKHLEFFEAGARYRERCFMAANRVSKTFGAGGYETSAHLTGLYPKWWKGRRFNHPVRVWCSGKTNESTRDVVQKTLMGEIKSLSGGRKGVTGTGVVPGDLIGDVTWKSGVPDLVDTAKIRHASGGLSLLGIKSYQQGRGSFEGTAQHVIWDDEEPPEDVYGEQLIRTATTNGITILTFTPLEGRSNVVKSFLPTDWRPDV